MTGKRIYDDGCGIAHAMNLIGERWAVLIIRELVLGPKRFTDLQAGLLNAGPNILAQRLRQLEAVGVLRRTTLPRPAGVRVYELTEWGARLGPILSALARWANAAPVVAPSGRIGADSLMLGLRDSFDQHAGSTGTATARTATFDIGLGDDRYTVHIADGRMEVVRGPAHRPDTTVSTDTETFARVLDNDEGLADAIDSGRLTVTGSRQALEQLLARVTRPPANPAPTAP